MVKWSYWLMRDIKAIFDEEGMEMKLMALLLIGWVLWVWLPEQTRWEPVGEYETASQCLAAQDVFQRSPSFPAQSPEILAMTKGTLHCRPDSTVPDTPPADYRPIEYPGRPKL